MAECVTWVQASVVDGGNAYPVTVLAPQSAADTEMYGCGYAWLLSDAELGQFRQLVAAPPGGSASSPAGASELLNLSVADALLISGAIAALWGLAWAVRAVRHAL